MEKLIQMILFLFFSVLMLIQFEYFYDGYMNKSKNNIKSENGILSFENEITMNLNRTLETINFNLDE